MRSLSAVLTRQQIDAITNGNAIEDVVRSYEKQIADLHAEAGEWQLLAQTAQRDAKVATAQADILKAENEGLKTDLEALRHHNRLLERLAQPKKQISKPIKTQKERFPDVGWIGDK